MELTFDRGTLVLRAGVAEPPPGALVDFVWDDRVDAWRAPAHRYPAVLERLRAHACVGRDRVGCRATRPIEIVPPPLRSYQEEALAAWEVAGGRGTVVLPTGSGKTWVAIAAMARLGSAALVLVPTRALLGQWARSIGDVAGVRAGVIGDGRRELAPITVCTFESALRHLDEFGHRFCLLVVDEVHHFGSGARCEALEMCPAPARLGLTATPPRGEDALARITELVGPIVFERCVQDFLGRHLAPMERSLVPVDLSAEERKRYDSTYVPFAAAARSFFRGGAHRTWADFMSAAASSPEGMRLVRGYREALGIVSTANAKLRVARRLIARHRDDRLLFFTADNAAAYAISKALLVPAVTCDIGRSEREDVLGRFSRGELNAVVSSRVLNEGLDVPEARVGVVLGGRHGGREHVQRVGRVLRPSPGKTALVYEVVARDTFESRQVARRQASLCFRRP